MALATAVQSDNTAKVQGQTIREFAVNFAPTASLVNSTSGHLQGDVLRVTQVYELDASNRKPGDSSAAEFTCALTGTTSETDFAIPGLPAGIFAFAIVEANGPHPWLLSFLLQQEGTQWKMAGFYPRARTAAGHDGLWYWRAARDAAKARHLWTAWLLYGEAAQLLQPANFVSSTNLDLLLSEQRTAVPPELSAGIGPETPLVVKGSPGGVSSVAGLKSASGASTSAGAEPDSGPPEFHFTAISAEGSADGSTLDLILHLQLPAGVDPSAPNPAAARARNTAAAAALLDAHKELRQEFQNVWVFAESTGHAPFPTEQKISEIP
jgi:hypothetical protein